ncbi:MAG: ankyrin repeat domain-containing protein [Candidatus Thiodiazotropha sp.]
MLKKALESRKGTLSQQDVDLALLRAAASGNFEGVKLLQGSGADIKAVDGNFDIAMILAAANQHIEVVRLLLQRGAPPNEANVHHYTPLVRACHNEDLVLVRLLLDHIDFQGCSQSISPQCEEENRKIPMIYHYSNTMKSFQWDTPLIIAINHKNLDLVRMLLDAHIPINETNGKGSTALHEAVSEDCPEILDLLLAARPNVDVVDMRNNTPLMKACLSRREQVMLKLLENGADVNIKQIEMDPFSPDVLYEATEFASQKLMEALCEAGADIDHKYYSSETPLSHAIKNKNLSAIKCLIRYGCALDTPRQVQPISCLKNQITLLHLTICQKDLAILTTLYTGGAFTNEVLYKTDSNVKLRNFCSKVPQIFESIEIYASNPQNLKLICRKTIREVIKRPLPQTVPQLGLPPSVSDFLLYSDI